METKGLHVADYIVFGAMLMVSIAIGLYHAFTGGRQSTNEEYIMGNRKMAVLPVTMSNTASFLSTILLLGYPAEIYSFGSLITMDTIGWSAGAVVAAFLVVPVMYGFEYTSVNEYLEDRFQSKMVRLIGCFCTISTAMLYAGTVYFGPSTAMEAVSGIPAWVSILVGSIISIIYTTIGGYKAVVWTDVLQCVFMVVGMIVVVIQGVIYVGGFSIVWETNKEWGRLNFIDMNVDPRTRMSTLSSLFARPGLSLCMFSFYQASFQRYCSMPTLTKAKTAVVGMIPGIVLLYSLSFLTGWVVFAYYTIKGCDPLSTGQLSNPNQVVPYFVMEIFNLPGLPGLFLSAAAAASLSSASSALNGASANVWEDIAKPLLPNVSKKTATLITKTFVALLGLVAMGLAFGITGVGGTMMQIFSTFQCALDGPLCGIFLSGLFLPWVNYIGISLGAVISSMLALWIAIGSYSIERHLDVLPTNNARCAVDVNSTLVAMANMTSSPFIATEAPYSVLTNTTSSVPEEGSFLHSLYSLSFFWLYLYTMLSTMILASIISLCTEPRGWKKVNPRYIHPLSKKVLGIKDQTYVATSEKEADTQEKIKSAEKIKSSKIFKGDKSSKSKSLLCNSSV